MPQILAAGVDCHYISFSYNDILMAFRQLIQEILMGELKDNQPASIELALPAPPSKDTQAWETFQQKHDHLKKLLVAFNNKYFCDFSIVETRNGFRVSTNYKTLEKITDGLTWYFWTWQRKAAWIWPGICGTCCRRRQRCCSMERRTICGGCCGSSPSG